MTPGHLKFPGISTARSCASALVRAHVRRASTIAQGPEVYDVVCIGGGPAGLSLLTALAASPVTQKLKACLIESQDLSRTRQWQSNSNSFSNRVSSLTPASLRFLTDIGAWRHVDLSRVQGYGKMQVWDGVSGAQISFDWGTRNVPPPNSIEEHIIAHMTENLNLSRGLLHRLDELGQHSILDNTKVESIDFGEDTDNLKLSSWPVVTLSDGKKLAARLLVGADGANSPVRTFAGIDSKGWDYDRYGLVATLRLDPTHRTDPQQKVAYQRFLPTGPVALLPLPGNFASLVWSTSPSHAALMRSLSRNDFVAMVNAAFRLSTVDLAFMHTQSEGQAEELAWREQHTAYDPNLVPDPVVDVQEGTVAGFPLRMRHADTYCGERVALVGDAAHTVHPLAGQGLNQGQGDVESLARAIDFAVRHGQDIGSQLSLEGYCAERYAANHILLGVVDKLHKLYSAEWEPVVALRSLGLSAINAVAPVKTFFMERAAGSR